MAAPGLDFNSIIAQALANVNGMSTGVPSEGVPALNSGQPLLPDDMLRNAVQAGMQQNAPISDAAKSNALIKIGAALMQPRMPGQSIAGNVGKGADEAASGLEAAQDKANARSTQVANTANAVATSDMARRAQDVQMQAFQAKFPAEYAELQAKLQEAQLNGQTAKATAILNAVKTNPELLAQTIRQDLEAKGATTAKTEAETKAEQAKGGYYDAYAKYLSGDKGVANKMVNLGSTKLDDGTVYTRYAKNGTEYTQHFIPGIQDQQQALKIAELQLKREKPGGWFGMGGPTPQEINDRAKTLMQDRTINTNVSNGQTVPQLPGDGPDVTASSSGDNPFNDGTVVTNGQVSAIPQQDVLKAKAAGVGIKGELPQGKGNAPATPQKSASGATVVTQDMLDKALGKSAPATPANTAPATDDLGTQLDVAKQKFESYGSMQQKKDPDGFATAKAKYLSLKKAYAKQQQEAASNDAAQELANNVDVTQAVRGRTFGK